MMKITYVIIGFLFLISIASARIEFQETIDPYLETYYGQMECWASFGDNLGEAAQSYYEDENMAPPAYLEENRTELMDNNGSLHDLYLCLQNDDPICFHSHVPAVMHLVNNLRDSFRSEARYAVFNFENTTSEAVMDDYTGAKEELFDCLYDGQQVQEIVGEEQTPV